MIDITNQIEAIERGVSKREGADGEEVVVLVRRTYDSATVDVWEALTDPERVKRWFYPVSGDLQVGGTFQLEGNAS
ncbi:MAG TPA: SRPBCC domain-containing protein, partial [Acidimicrobiia bacterium]|nr:SRPBCC domain-containing protein [Acidimicrobiia bacterium]